MPHDHGWRGPVSRLLFLRGPLHDSGRAGQGQAVPSTGDPKPRRRARAPGSTWLEDGGVRRLEGTRPPHSTASSRHWPGRDCMVRARRRVPPAARRLPCRGLRAPADSGGRWRRSQDAPRSAPPPRSRTLSRPPPVSSERCATAAAEPRAQADCPLPPRPGHLPLMPAGRPRPGPAPSRPAPSWAAPPCAPHVPAHRPAARASPGAPRGPARSGQRKSVSQ